MLFAPLKRSCYPESLRSYFKAPLQSSGLQLSWFPSNACSKSRIQPTHTMSRSLTHPKRHKVTIVGSGNWGTTLAKVVAENTKQHPKIFEEDVQMWVFDETVKHPKTGKDCKLSGLINEVNENVKYLEGVTLPKNVIANPDIEAAVKNSSILVFVLPHQFIGSTLKMLQKDGVILPYARAISCAKGVDVDENGKVRLLSNMVQQSLNIYCGALSGANIASEIARGKWSETTVAYHPPEIDSQHPTPHTSRQTSPSQSTTDLAGNRISPESASKRSDKIVLKALPSEYPPLSHENVRKLFHREYFHVQMIDDVAGVGLGGALKNVIALAAGFVDGLGWGDNAKAAVMRIGLLEEVKFGKMFFGEQVRTGTFTEQSCGIADVITSCSGGRNFRCAKMAVEKGKKVPDVEKEELNGQKLQGTGTTDDVHDAVVAKLGSEKEFRKEFPLFAAVYDILHSGEKDKNGNTRPEVKYEDIPKLVGRPEGQRANL